MVAKLILTCFLIFLTGYVVALECVMDNDGSSQFREHGEVIEPKPFDCIRITRPLETTVSITHTSKDDEGRKICQIQEDGLPKDKKIFLRSNVPTDMRCKYTCKRSDDLFKCITETSPSDNACICEPALYRVITERVTDEIHGQSEAEEERSCDGRQEGFQFPDPIPCSSMQADIDRRRVDYTGNDDGMCNVVPSIKTETRYTEVLPSHPSYSPDLQGCLYVCKMAGPRCTEEETDDGKCKCASPGLTGRLVPMNEVELNEAVRTIKNGKITDCGPCGFLNHQTNDCELHRDAHNEDRCPCGEICPVRDIRKGNRRTKIGCVSNVKLECMRKASWLKNVSDVSKPGTRIANLCRQGSIDALDTCSCADGYIQRFNSRGIYCTHPESRKELETARRL